MPHPIATLLFGLRSATTDVLRYAREDVTGTSETGRDCKSASRTTLGGTILCVKTGKP